MTGGQTRGCAGMTTGWVGMTAIAQCLALHCHPREGGGHVVTHRQGMDSRGRGNDWPPSQHSTMQSGGYFRLKLLGNTRLFQDCVGCIAGEDVMVNWKTPVRDLHVQPVQTYIRGRGEFP